MTEAGQTTLLARAAILKLLSDGEITSVSSAEAKTDLRKGDEYLDLEHLLRGVQRADGSKTNAASLLPRRAVHEDTWRRILRQLNAALR